MGKNKDKNKINTHAPETGASEGAPSEASNPDAGAPNTAQNNQDASAKQPFFN